MSDAAPEGPENSGPADRMGAAAGPPEPPPPPFDPAPWGLLGALVMPVLAYGAQFILALLVSAFAAVVLVALDPNLASHGQELAEATLLVSIAPAALVSSLVTLGLIYGSVTLVHRRPFFEALRLCRPTAGGLASFALIGAVTASFYLAMAGLFPPAPDQELGGPLARLVESGPLGQAIWLMLALLMAPGIEEILFRGYAFLGARQKAGPLWAGTGVTVLFVALHMTETGTYWPALAGIATMATVLVIIVQRTGNLTYCIAAHFGYNGTLALLSLLAER